MIIQNNLQKLKDSLSKEITLVAVSKTKPNPDILEAYNAGQRIFGENKVQEMVGKFETLPKDIKWHMIGHLQSNKIKYMAHFVSLIHGVDSLKTLKEINKQAEKNNRIIDCLLQIKIATEETKFGISTIEIESILKSDELANFKNIKIIGFMGMASFTSNKKQVTNEFKKLKILFDASKSISDKKNIDLQIISMGMSGDYQIAIKNGSNMIRVGSAIFGNRNY